MFNNSAVNFNFNARRNRCGENWQSTQAQFFSKGFVADLQGGGASWNSLTFPFQCQLDLNPLIVWWTITKTIPAGVVNFLIFTIQQIVDNKNVYLKNDGLLIKMY